MKRLMLKKDGLSGVGPAPVGFKYVGLDDRGQISEKEGSSIKQVSGDGTDPRDFIIQKISKELSNAALERGVIQPDTDFDLPDNGIYILSSVETYLKFAEAVSDGGSTSYGISDDPYRLTHPFGSTASININISASVETYLKFSEATSGSNLNVSYGLTDFSENFISLIDNKSYLDRNSTTDAEFLDRILDKGLVEFGSFKNKSKLDYYNVIKNFNTTIEDYLKIADSDGMMDETFYKTILLGGSVMGLLDYGIAVYRFNGIISISSVQSLLKLLEYQRSIEEKEQAIRAKKEAEKATNSILYSAAGATSSQS
jgi:hypothetical protein